MKQKLLYLFTRTPLHVGAGSSVGAIDQPIQRERHTGFPIIPGSSIKGVFADAWNHELIPGGNGKRVRPDSDDSKEVSWLFGNEDSKAANSGALHFGEARLLAFPIRSAKGGYAWITCPLILRRAARDGVFCGNVIDSICETPNEQALFKPEKVGINDSVVLEEYTFKQAGLIPDELGKAFQALLNDPVWKESDSRLVILSDGMMSFFTQSTCEVAQHVKINDETGTASSGALFNQENVPADTLFYSVINGVDHAKRNKTGEMAFQSLETKLADNRHLFQFGGDASTGLGFCTVELK